MMFSPKCAIIAYVLMALASTTLSAQVQKLDSEQNPLWKNLSPHASSHILPDSHEFILHQQQLSIDNDLGGHPIRAILQDSIGFIWIASKGLFRYDGYTFKHYVHDPADSTSIRSNDVRSLFSDHDGNLWISTPGGLDRYVYQTDNFQHYNFLDEENNTLPCDISALAQDLSGELFVAINFAPDSLYRMNDVLSANNYDSYINRGIYRLDLADKRFTPVTFINEIINGFARRHLMSDSNDDGIFEETVLFPATHFGDTLEYRYYIVRKDNSVEGEFVPDAHFYGWRVVKLDHHGIELPLNAFSENRVAAKPGYLPEQEVLEDIKVKFKVDLTKLQKPIQEGDAVQILGSLFPLRRSRYNMITDAAFDRRNLLWVALADYGVLSFDLNNKSYQHFYSSPSKANSISYNEVHDIFIDRHGDIWLGTGSGLDKYDPASKSFYRYSSQPYLRRNSPFNSILKITEHPQANFLALHGRTPGISLFHAHYDQPIRFEAVTKQFMTSLMFDRSGILWAGSRTGEITKIKFASPQFVTPKAVKNRTDLLKNHALHAIFEDRNGNIWAGGNFGGLYQFDRHSHQFSRHDAHSLRGDSLNPGLVRGIVEDTSGAIWICTSGIVSRFDPKNNRFDHFKNNSPVFANRKNSFISHVIARTEEMAASVYAADIDNDGDIDVLSAAELGDRIAWYENDGNENFTLHVIAANEDGPTSVRAADVDNDGDVDVLAAYQDPVGDKVEWYENDGRENFTPRLIIGGRDYYTVFPIDLDIDGDVDVLSGSMYDNTLTWHENDGQQKFTHHIISSGRGIIRSVYALDLDNDKDIDILSASDVSNQINWHENDGSQNFRTHIIASNVLGASSVYAIDLDGDGDIDLLSSSEYDDTIAWYENDGFQNFAAHTIANDADGAFSICSVDMDADGDPDVISASTIDHEIRWYENDGDANFRAHIIASDAAGARSVFAKDIDRDGDIDILSASRLDNKIAWYENVSAGVEISGICIVGGVLWTVSRDGFLAGFNLGEKSFKNYRLAAPMISDMDHDRNGFLWMTSRSGGLYKFDPRRESFEKVLINHNGTHLRVDQSGTIWYNGNNGLHAFAPETQTRKTISEKDGLLSNNITGIEIDDSGNIWLSSQHGLSKYDPNQGSVINFFEEDGFNASRFNDIAHHKSATGEIYFATMDGFVVFTPDSFPDPVNNTAVILTELSFSNPLPNGAEDQSLNLSLLTTQEVSLNHHQNDISITFSTLDFDFPKRNRYSYMLENYDDNWRQPGFNRTAEYYNLEPGEYIFKVKSSNRNNVWSEQPASLTITILPPWWRSTWAYSGYLFVIIGLLYAIYRYDVRRRTLLHQVELEQLESRKLKEIDQMKSRFFANISHEFRTPLTLMVGPVEQMLSGEFRGNIKKQYGMILRNGQKLLHLINQLLDIAQLEAGQMALQAAEGDIIDFLKKTVSAFESLAVRQEIDLSLRTPPKTLPVYFDSDKLEKIMTNLLGNAFKFTHKNGSVTVACQFMNDFVEITVEDNGIGIAAERLPHIFNRFYQADDSYTREQEGSGIGLALTKELVELHRGEIFVDSAPGEGTTFTLRLPLGKTHLAEAEIINRIADFGTRNGESEKILSSDTALPIPPAASSISPSAIRNRQSAVVLIVEDNPDMRSYLKESLEENFKVLLAVDGAQGLKKASKAIPDLIISDVMMPEMDGYQLCRRLKEDERTSHIPVILLTAKADPDSKIEGLETGADDYLAKPFNSRELLVRSKNLIALRRRLWEKFRHNATFAAADLALTSVDEQFLQRVLTAIESHLSQPDFSTQTLAKQVGLSRSQLHRKLQGLTGLSTHEFIRTLRLNRAAQLLQHHTGNVSEIAYQVGFNSPSHFSRAFREIMGMSPSEYAKRHCETDTT